MFDTRFAGHWKEPVILGTVAGLGYVSKIQWPYGKNYEHSLRLLFPTTNNMAKYKTTFRGLKMLRGMEVENVTLHTNSQLVAHQAIEEFTIKEPKNLCRVARRTI